MTAKKDLCQWCEEQNAKKNRQRAVDEAERRAREQLLVTIRSKGLSVADEEALKSIVEKMDNLSDYEKGLIDWWGVIHSGKDEPEQEMVTTEGQNDTVITVETSEESVAVEETPIIQAEDNDCITVDNKTTDSCGDIHVIGEDDAEQNKATEQQPIVDVAEPTDTEEQIQEPFVITEMVAPELIATEESKEEPEPQTAENNAEEIYK